MPPVRGVPYQKGPGTVNATRQAVVSRSEKTGSRAPQTGCTFGRSTPVPPSPRPSPARGEGEFR